MWFPIGLFASLVLGLLAVLFMAKVARESGRDPFLWGLFSVLVMIAAVVIVILLGPLMRSRGSALLMAWLFGAVVIQFFGQGVLFLVLHFLEGKASRFVESRLPVFLLERPGEQLGPSELRFEKTALELHEHGVAEPLTIAFSDLRAAEPDGEVVRIRWQSDTDDVEQLSFMLADEELSATARRAQGISVVAKLNRLAQLTP